MNALFLASLITAFVAGHAVPVACSYLGGYAGTYVQARDVIVLDPFVCAGFSAPPTSRRKAGAVYSLVHEAEHARGIVGEHDAECAALADFPAVIRGAGLSVKLIRFARLIHEAMPPPYSGACV